jgi:hypothetical protein
VVVYFSTHGTLARGPDGELARYLVATDSNQDRIQQSAVLVRELLSRFESLPSRRKLLILASCHSGSGKSALPVEMAGELRGIKGAFFVRPLHEISQASMVLTACAWGETAREDDQLGHDIYTAFLLEALRQGDTDRDGAVTASEAHAQAMAKTYYFSGGRQRPQVESSVLGTDPIVLCGQKTGPADPVLFSFLPRLEGLRIEVDGRDKGALPARLVLPEGAHHVVIKDQGAPAPLLDEQVRLGAGEELSIESLLEQNQPHFLLSALGGYQRFLDSKTRQSLVAPLGAGGLSLTVLRFPFDLAETGLDLTLGGGPQHLQIGGLPVTQDLLQIEYGLWMLFRLDLGPVSLLAGPRLAGMHLLRRNLSTADQDQHFFNITPGLVFGLRTRLWAGWSLALQARVHFFAVKTDQDRLDLGYLDLVTGVGYSF